MFKRLPRRPPWICPTCRQRTRTLSGLATAPTTVSQTPPPAHSEADDAALQQIFDSDPFWRSFNSTAAARSNAHVGLLGNKHLTSPAGFANFAKQSLSTCSALVARLTNDPEAAKIGGSSENVLSQYRTPEEAHARLPRDFDRLSDALCRVIDSVDFLRAVHPNASVQRAAAEAHAAMYEYMNVLNTHTGLYTALEGAVASETAAEKQGDGRWTEEEMATTRILLRDFGQSAIGQPEHVRRRFVEVANEIAQTGTEMLELMAPAASHVAVERKRLQGMDSVQVARLTRGATSSTARIPTSGGEAYMALRTVQDSEVRRQLYTAGRASSKDSIARVERLVRLRAELAGLCGYESFAHMTLSDKMAQTPQAVDGFLRALAADNKTYLDHDLEQLLQLKQADASSLSGPVKLEAWDRQYYTRRLRRLLNPTAGQHEGLSAYFSLGNVMQGLSRLFTRLYGVRLVPKETPPGETWNDDIRRLDVMDETDGHIAVLYCDLFERANKSPNPAHFTLRCSREISSEEIAEVAPSLPPNPSLADLSDALNDGMALNFNPQTGTLHQLPTIAFICDFPRPPMGSPRPTLLSFSQVCTLFHEMGHALHSILGRTKLQNVAGTRCATDFAELPSILMEYFAASPEVLGLYARHWQTGKPLDPQLVARELQETKRLLASQETETQVLFSVLDQRYHSPEVTPAGAEGKRPWDSTEVYLDVYNDPLYSSSPEPRGASWQGFFTHLFGYGAVYYSYLFDRAIAGRVWDNVFRDAPLERARGQQYRDEVLKWGGGRDGWHCVAGVLGREKYGWMEDGGEKAMEEVGKWGAGEAGHAGAPL